MQRWLLLGANHALVFPIAESLSPEGVFINAELPVQNWQSLLLILHWAHISELSVILLERGINLIPLVLIDVMGVENFLRRVDERLLSIKSGAVLVVPQLHAKIQQLLVWLTGREVLVVDQVLEFGGISGIIDINCAWGIGWLPALPPLHDSLVLVIPFSKLWLHWCLQLGCRDEPKTCLEPRILI